MKISSFQKQNDYVNRNDLKIRFIFLLPILINFCDQINLKLKSNKFTI